MTAAAPFVAVLAFAAVSSAPFERSLRSTLTERTGVRVTHVGCPSRVPLRARATFTCHVRFSSHDRSPVRVRLKDTKGRYSSRLRDLLVRHLESQLARSARKRDLSGPFTCPKRRAVAKGDRFTCTAETTVARIRQLGDGRVRFTFDPL
jgi:hypothetical protein